ncbi:MAG TPA: GNAT family N-acetyltransferase [Pyrinomonadaceae bacterium]
METTFTPARPADADLLVGLVREFYEFEHIAFDERAARAALLQLLSDGRLGRVFLIRSGGDVAGHLVITFGFSLEFGGRDAFVDELFLRGEFRRRGIGRRALAFAEEQCREAGVGALHLEVERANAAAQELYRRSGFKDHDRYLLTKWITP